MNPNAASFTFKPSATAFVPGASWGAPAPAAAAPAPAVAAAAAAPAPAVKEASPAPAKAAPEEPAESWDDDDVGEAEDTASAAAAPAEAAKEPEADVPEPEPDVKASEPEVDAAHEEDDDEESEEEDDGRKHVNIMFIGHVDAGKSTLCGQIMWQSGNIDERTLQKFEDDAKAKNRESWKFAYAMDTNEEERDKGKTVEVGRAYFTTEHKKFTVLDCPGHKNFVPHMISGAAQADIGVLVISARKGEFEAGFEKGGQTTEHIILAKTAGVNELIIVLNKMDDDTVKWSEERYTHIKNTLFPFLKQSGFKPKKECKWMPISALGGINIKDPLPEGTCPWWTGQSLLDTLDTMPPPERLMELPARMGVTDKFTERGALLIMGKIQCGVFTKGQKCVLMPINQDVEIDTIKVYGRDAAKAEPGDNCKMIVKGCPESQMCPGYVLCPRGAPCKTATIFDAQIKIDEYKSILCPGYTCVLHIHTVVEDVMISNLLYKCKNGKPDPTKKNPKFVKTGDMVIARLRVSRSICIETFKEFDKFGRFMLRDEGKTVGFGVVKVLRK